MPRIYSSCNDPIDFCRRCFPSEVVAKHNWGNVGDGPDGRGNCFDYDSEHPDYDDPIYCCERCGILLTSNENHKD